MGKRIMVVFGSETGNTEAGAGIIARRLEGLGHAVTLAKAPDAGMEVFDQPFDLWLIGVSTWGALENEVQQDFMPFYEAMENLDLGGKAVAVFGSGDRGYGAENFARAVDYVESRARAHGARIVVSGLKWHQAPDDEREAIADWAEAAAGA